MKVFIYLLLVSLAMGCNSVTPYDHIDSKDVRTILQKGIEASGGLKNWQNLGGYSFTKRTLLYHADGSIEVKNQQHVSFRDFPELKGEIEWDNQSDTVETKISFDSKKAIKYVDGKPSSEMTNEAARRSFLGSHIVMSLPFKLLDPGVELSYLGKSKQYDTDVEVILAEYNAEEENHTETHKWWHYFDANDFKYLGYKVFHPPTFALVENLKTTEHGGITFPVDRITWRVDSLDNKEYIRAKFAYSDFKTTD